MYQAELDEVFQEILIISKEDFISFITNGVKILIIRYVFRTNI